MKPSIIIVPLLTIITVMLFFQNNIILEVIGIFTGIASVILWMKLYELYNIKNSIAKVTVYHNETRLGVFPLNELNKSLSTVAHIVQVSTDREGYKKYNIEINTITSTDSIESVCFHIGMLAHSFIAINAFRKEYPTNSKPVHISMN